MGGEIGLSNHDIPVIVKQKMLAYRNILDRFQDPYVLTILSRISKEDRDKINKTALEGRYSDFMTLVDSHRKISELGLVELRDIARRKGVKGYQRKGKEDILQLLAVKGLT